ncbi:MAG TPA: hypothetical protein VJ767_10990 [Nitrososphaeraceae archaeon]|nr:hypothetical protein [Nitrososphaeraceae archaeon]
MTDFPQYFHRYVFTIIFIVFVSLIAIESLSIQLHVNTVQHVSAQSLSTNTPIVDDNLQEQNKSKVIKAFGHFANNQIKDGIVTWIQGGFWELTINNIANDSSSSSSNLNNNNNGKADFIANFTMIKPDGSLSHNHNIGNFISDKVILTGKDIVVMGIANIYSDDNNSEYKNVPLTIHLMGNKVLGLTIDVSKTEGHFSSQNEMFGTLISGVGLDTSSTDNSVQTLMHHDTATNDTVEKESMTMIMQH